MSKQLLNTIEKLTETDQEQSQVNISEYSLFESNRYNHSERDGRREEGAQGSRRGAGSS